MPLQGQALDPSEITRLGLAWLFCALSNVLAYGVGMLMALRVNPKPPSSNGRPSGTGAPRTARSLRQRLLELRSSDGIGPRSGDADEPRRLELMGPDLFIALPPARAD